MDELATFLTIDSRVDVKLLALQQILGVSASPEGISALVSSSMVLTALKELLTDPLEPVSSEASLVLINLCSSTSSCSSVLALQPPVVPILFKLMQDKKGLKSKLAEKSSMLLSNLTRDPSCCREVYRQLVQAKVKISQLVSLLCEEGEGNLVYLGPTLSNLSQLSGVRGELLDTDQCVVQRLLSFTEYSKSTTKRGGVVGTLKNCCFSTASHPWLIGDAVDIIPRLVLPLAGPTPDQLTEKEVESLPLDLQYLEEDKKIEEDLDIKTMLLESLTQLCATRHGREEMRNKNIYLILRQFHLQEEDNGVRLAAENLIDILIKTEEEIKIDCYKDVDIPEDVVPQLLDMDKAYLNND